MTLPTDAESASRWMREERTKRGWSTTILAEKARAVARREGSPTKMSQQLISAFEQPGAKKIPDWLRFVRKAFEESEPSAASLPARVTGPGDGTVWLKQIDLSLSMGPGSDVDDFAEEGLIEFDLALLRTMTRTAPELIVIGRGIGDSMTPTILDADLTIIDTSQRMLNMQDRIWAISVYGAGGIKRLRTKSREVVEVISDNPSHDSQDVAVEDIQIMGRIVGSIRRH